MPALHVVLAISIAAVAIHASGDQGAGVPASETAQGLTPPALVKEVKPSYTAEAKIGRAHV